MKNNTKSGYLGIGPEKGTFVPEEDAFDYALYRCLHGTEEEQKEFREAFIDWYYSGNFTKTEVSECQ